MIEPNDIKQILHEADGEELYQTATLVKRALVHQKPMPEVDVETQWQRFRSAHPQPKRTYWRTIAACLTFVTVMTVVALTLPQALNRWQTPAESVAPVQADMATTAQTMVFHDVALGEVLEAVAAQYGAQVSCMKPQLLQTHLYTQIDKSLTLPEVVHLLNNFDNITLRLSGDNLIVVE